MASFPSACSRLRKVLPDLDTPGHVPSELCVSCPSSKVLSAGDAIHQGMPPNARFAGPQGKADGKDEIGRDITLPDSEG